MRQCCAFFDDDPVLFSYLLLAQHGQLQKVTPEMPNPVEVVREVLAAGMDRGEIPAGDPDVAAAMVLGIVLQVAIFKIYQRLTQSLTSLAEVLVAATLAGCGRLNPPGSWQGYLSLCAPCGFNAQAREASSP